MSFCIRDVSYFHTKLQPLFAVIVCVSVFASTTTLFLQPQVSCIAHNGVISRKSPQLSLSAPAFRSHCACAESCQILALGKPPALINIKRQAPGHNYTQ